MKKKICVVTGSRAEYGHLQWLMKELKNDPAVALQIVVTGTHLSAKHGLTYREIEKNGFKITARFKSMLFDDSEKGITESLGLACRRFAQVFARIRPDMIVILGDRYEMLAAAIAAYIGRMPIAHIHGGERTGGLIDEGIRHSITKMASLHFAATEEYRRRIIQMGEAPRQVFNYGAPGLDSLYKIQLLSRKELGEALDLDLSGQIALVTFHPVTLESGTSLTQIKALLKAIDKFKFKAIFTATNSDTSGRAINRAIIKFCDTNPSKYHFVPNLGQLKYFSCLRHFDLMIGNSSSGLVEAPSFKLPAVNIGDRQLGRIKAKNVIDVGPGEEQIEKGIKQALSKAFIRSLKKTVNPYDIYGDGKNSLRIKNKIRRTETNAALLKKDFYDLDFVLRGKDQ